MGHGMAGLAVAYRERAAGNRSENLEHAFRYFERALQVIRREDSPMLWATTQHNLATVYCLRSEGNRAKNLEHAPRAAVCSATGVPAQNHGPTNGRR